MRSDNPSITIEPLIIRTHHIYPILNDNHHPEAEEKAGTVFSQLKALILLSLNQEISYITMRYFEYDFLELLVMIKSVRGRTADVLKGLSERIKDDALPYGFGLSPRNTIIR